MSKVLYVTSFNKQLFDLTGKKMVESFLETDIEGDLLVTYEENIGSSIPESDKVKLYNLDDSEFLSSWLEKNKDIINEKRKIYVSKNKQSRWFYFNNND